MSSDPESLADAFGVIAISDSSSESGSWAYTPSDSSSDTSSEATVTGNTYWYKFDGFVPNPAAGIPNEFSRLAKFKEWTVKERQLQKIEAYESEFDFWFVTGRDKLDTWQYLCTVVGIDDVPHSITQCKKALKTVHVNLVNLINHRRNPGNPLIVFPTYKAFRNYTQKKGRCYPKQAKAGGFANALLRDVFNRH